MKKSYLFLAMLLPVIATAQLKVSPTSLTFTAAEVGSYAPYAQTITVTNLKSGTPAAFTIAKNPDNYIFSSGTSVGSVSIGVNCWKINDMPAGTYMVDLEISSDSGNITVPLTLDIVAGPPVNFSYISGPNGCVNNGYKDAAQCTVPGEWPSARFIPPATGGKYTDPNFGATVRMLSAPPSIHNYSSPSALSAHNKYLYVAGYYNYFASLVSPVDGSVLLSHFMGDVTPVWDAYDDEVFYYTNGATIRKYDVQAAQSATYVDYSQPPFNFISITRGGTGDATKDNLVSFWAPNEQKLGVLDLNTKKTYLADYSNVPGVHMDFIDYTMMAKGYDAVSGKRYVIMVASPSIAVYSLDTINNKLNFEFRGPENPEVGNGNHDNICDPGEPCFGAYHCDTFEDSEGNQYIFASFDTQCSCERTLATYLIRKKELMMQPVQLGGGRTKVMMVTRCGDVWVGDHVGGSRNSPSFVYSADYPEGQDGRDPLDSISPMKRGGHTGEIIGVTVIGGKYDIRRLAMHRSVLFKGDTDYSYWSQTKSCISADGSLVISTTNFSDPNPATGIRVIGVETGFDFTGIHTEVAPGKMKVPGIKAYPNPADEMLNIQVDNYPGNAELTIVSIDGKIVYSKKLEIGIGRYTGHIETSYLAKGFYIIKITGEKDMMTARAVVR